MSHSPDLGPRGHAPASADDMLYVIRVMAAVMDAADPYARGRSNRILGYARATAGKLGLEGSAFRDVEIAALLHDVGRTAIERDILLKPGALTSDERAQVQTHPEVGYELLRRVSDLVGAADLIRAHHEQPDGRGYPRGLSGDDVPLGSQIILVASAYDALTTDRPYRAGLDRDQALEEIRRCEGTQFLSCVVDAFEESLREGSVEFEDEAFPLAVATDGIPCLSPSAYMHHGSRSLEIDLPDDFQFPDTPETGVSPMTPATRRASEDGRGEKRDDNRSVA